MLNDLIIRAETPADYKNAELVAVRSFWNKYWSGCTEHLLIRIIRDSADYIPAKLADTVTEKPQAGSDVQFAWNHKGVSTITKVFRNLLET